MIDPNREWKDHPMVPHPDDEAEVRAGLEEAERGDVLSEQESSDYLEALLDRDRSKQ